MIGRSQKPARGDSKSFDRPAATPTSDPKVDDELRAVMQGAPEPVQVDESTEAARARAETITRINLHMKVAAVNQRAQVASATRAALETLIKLEETVYNTTRLKIRESVLIDTVNTSMTREAAEIFFKAYEDALNKEFGNAGRARRKAQRVPKSRSPRHRLSGFCYARHDPSNPRPGHCLAAPPGKG